MNASSQYTAGDQLGDLAAEIEDQDAVGHGWESEVSYTRRVAGCTRTVRASRRALRALLSMRDTIDGIKKIPHPEEAAKRPSRRTHRADPACGVRISPQKTHRCRAAPGSA